MVSKKSRKLSQDSMKQKQIFSMRKLSIGLASVVLGSLLFTTSQSVSADSSASSASSSEVSSSSSSSATSSSSSTNSSDTSSSADVSASTNSSSASSSSDESSVTSTTVSSSTAKSADTSSSSETSSSSDESSATSTTVSSSTAKSADVSSSSETSSSSSKSTNADSSSASSTSSNADTASADTASASSSSDTTDSSSTISLDSPSTDQPTADKLTEDSTGKYVDSEPAVVNDLNKLNQTMTTEDGLDASWAAYITATGSDGKTYVTSYFGSNGEQTIIDTNTADLSNLELHVVLKNGATEQNILNLITLPKYLQIDASRLSASGITVNSTSGTDYSKLLTYSSGDGKYTSYSTYVSSNDISMAKYVYANGMKVAANDTISYVIPITYTGSTSSTIGQDVSLTNYNTWTSTYLRVYFTQPVSTTAALGETIIPAVLTSTNNDFQYVSELQQYMPSLSSVLHFTNYYNYNGNSFDTSNVPSGENPEVIYGSANFYLDLDAIEAAISSHGYTVQFMKNTSTGKVEVMHFYTYNMIPGAVINSDGSLEAGSILSTGAKAYVSVIPAILLNDDQTYTASSSNGEWDPTSMVAHFYDAGYDVSAKVSGSDSSGRVPESDLTELDKVINNSSTLDDDGNSTGLQVAYEVSYDGGTTWTTTDKVDLTKYGLYKVTYSHTYHNQVVSNTGYVYVNEDESDSKTVTRTINYVDEAGNKLADSTTQTVTLTRTGTKDDVTGEVTWGDWSTGSFDEVTSPTIKGYTTTTSVPSEDVTSDSSDSTVNVVYTKNATSEVTDSKTVTRTINYVDESGNKLADSKTQTVTLTRTGTKDDVTGEITWGDWSTGSFDEVTSPTIKGYKTTTTSVPSADVTSDSSDTTVDVVYKKSIGTDTDNVTPEKPDNGNKDQGQSDNENNNNSGQNQNTGTETDNELVKEPAIKNQTTQLTKNTGVTTSDVKVEKASVLPQTGDNTKSASIFGILLAGVAGVLGLAADRKRKRE